ncbi:MAG: hypothetical protein FD137_220 [Spirochaetes bacterium]|nr:MAG: hypothetical protein FD137_220 [Spirochaetota bacterium]
MNPTRNPVLRFFALSLTALGLALSALSCSAKLDATVRNDLSARIALNMEVPGVLGERMRQISNIPQSSPLFDAPRLRKEFLGRKSINIVDLSVSTPDSMFSTLYIPNLEVLSNDRSVAPEGLLTLRSIPASASSPAYRELGIKIDRQNAAAAFNLFPGVDKTLLASLGPPALDKDPLTAQEYRMNLEQVIIGKRAMSAFDLCGVDISFSAPKPIHAASGGTFQGQVFKGRIGLFDLLTLEKPVTLSIRWVE